MSAAHILVVDDEADIRGLLKEILSEEGYDVDVAGDAGQARASRARQRPTSCCSTSGCPTPTASRCCANGPAPAPIALPGRHDVRPRHGRDRGRGHAPRRIRLRREAAVAREAAAHGGAALWRPASGSDTPASCCAAAPGVPVGTQPRHAAAARRARADRRATTRPCCWSVSPARAAKRFARFVHEPSPRRVAPVRHADRRAALRGDARRSRCCSAPSTDGSVAARCAGAAPVAARCSSTSSKICRPQRSARCSA